MLINKNIYRFLFKQNFNRPFSLLNWNMLLCVNKLTHKTKLCKKVKHCKKRIEAKSRWICVFTKDKHNFFRLIVHLQLAYVIFLQFLFFTELRCSRTQISYFKNIFQLNEKKYCENCFYYTFQRTCFARIFTNSR